MEIKEWIKSIQQKVSNYMKEYFQFEETGWSVSRKKSILTDTWFSINIMNTKQNPL